MERKDGQVHRAISDREAVTLAFMLAVEDARLEPLRRQADVLTVVWECTCGCATVNFEVDRSRSSAAGDLCSPVTEAASRARDTDEFSELILFLKDGWLSSLEIVWYSKPIPEFPPVSEFEPATLRC
jgi:hypothetical protein